MALVVFSVQGRNHDSDGNPDLMTYENPPKASEGGGWNGSSTFNAPEPGIYFFSISFVRDANTGGTEDDVYVFLRKQGADVGFAWCGAGSGKRSTGAYSVAIRLAKNDRIETFAGSDAGRRRVFPVYQFSGFLVH